MSTQLDLKSLGKHLFCSIGSTATSSTLQHVLHDKDYIIMTLLSLQMPISELAPILVPMMNTFYDIKRLKYMNFSQFVLWRSDLRKNAMCSKEIQDLKPCP